MSLSKWLFGGVKGGIWEGEGAGGARSLSWWLPCRHGGLPCAPIILLRHQFASVLASTLWVLVTAVSVCADTTYRYRKPADDGLIRVQEIDSICEYFYFNTFY